MKHIVCIILACLGFLATQAQGYHMDGMEVKPDGNVVFETGTATLKPESDVVLGAIKRYLDEKTYVTLMRIEGHVTGSSKDQALSEARANTVAKWLIAAGVDCKRLIPVGFGSTKPVSEEPGANTRIAFVNAALRGRAIGGMPVDGSGQVAGDPCN